MVQFNLSSIKPHQHSPTRTTGVVRAIVVRVIVLCSVALCIIAWKPYTTSQGALIRWPAVALSAPITYSVDAAGLPADALPAHLLADHAAAAFASWQAVRCPSTIAGEPRRVELRFASVGLRPAQSVGLVCAEPSASGCQRYAANGNQLIFVQPGQSWPHGSLVAALTLLSARSSSGELVDVDIVVNGADFSFCASTCGAEQVPVALMLRHETGHFLGLDHSDVAGALMVSAQQQDVRSDGSLQADDVAGICSLYPPVVVTAAENTALEREPARQPAVVATAGCSAGPGGESRRPWPLILLVAVVLVASRRRSSSLTACHSCFPRA